MNNIGSREQRNGNGSFNSLKEILFVSFEVFNQILKTILFKMIDFPSASMRWIVLEVS